MTLAAYLAAEAESIVKIKQKITTTLINDLESENHTLSILTITNFCIAWQSYIHFTHHNQSSIDSWSYWLE